MTKREIDGELSKDQRNTLTELQNLTDEQGYPPTVEELAERLKLRKSIVHNCLNKLIDRGCIRKTPGKARGMEVVRSSHAPIINVVSIPVLGSVPAGNPISVDESQEGEVLVQSNIVGTANCFALYVSGHSMRDADILHGDMLIVRQQPLAEDNDVIVASVDGEVTVKRLSMREGVVQLLPANVDFNPIPIHPKTDFRVLGKVIATRRLLTRVC